MFQFQSYIQLHMHHSESDDISSENEEKEEQTKPNGKISQLNSKSINKSKIVSPTPSPAKQVISDPTGLFEENKKLRRKLKELSYRLDDQIQKAVENKLKQNSQKNNNVSSVQSQNMELQNAYKMIERLQKAVKDYESKESYQVTLKRVMDLEDIIKNKQIQNEELKAEIKTQKKLILDKDRHIEQLIDNSKKMGNPTEELEKINKLKAKMKKIAEENELLRKKELEKHEKLIKAERKVLELEQRDEIPIGREESLLKQIEEHKQKYKEAMQRVERQNIYITRLNERLSRQSKQPKSSERESERKVTSKSVQQLPNLKKKVQTADLLQHLPLPKVALRLKRY